MMDVPPVKNLDLVKLNALVIVLDVIEIKNVRLQCLDTILMN